MMYVDEDLCAGCGICLEVCPQDAVSLREARAIIDAARCTSCGRCAEICAPGAIIEVDIVDRRPFYPTVPGADSDPAMRPGATSLSSARPEGPTPTQPYAATRMERPSKLQMADKVLSGLLNVLAFALDRGQGRRSISGLKGVINRRTPVSSNAGVPGPRRRSVRCGGRMQKRGAGRGSGPGRREHRRGGR
jgi:NAD-dependent dihydropyrimidine dehydrogenase PreA subunit